jgi:hypothetical protein
VPSIIKAARKTPAPGQPQMQAPSTYPEDMPGSGSAYLGTSPKAPPAPMKKAAKFPAGRTHAPRKRF